MQAIAKPKQHLRRNLLKSRKVEDWLWPVALHIESVCKHAIRRSMGNKRVRALQSIGERSLAATLVRCSLNQKAEVGLQVAQNAIRLEDQVRVVAEVRP